MDDKLKAAVITTGLSLIPIGIKLLENLESDIRLIGLGVIVVGAALVGGGIYWFASQFKQELKKIYDRMEKLN